MGKQTVAHMPTDILDNKIDGTHYKAAAGRYVQQNLIAEDIYAQSAAGSASKI